MHMDTLTFIQVRNTSMIKEFKWSTLSVWEQDCGRELMAWLQSLHLTLTTQRKHMSAEHTHTNTHTHSFTFSHTHTHALFHSHTHILSHLDQALVFMRTTSPDKVSFKAGEYPEEVKKIGIHTYLFLRSRSDALLSTSCENAIPAAKQNDFSPAFIRSNVFKRDTLHVCSCVTVMSAHSVQLWWQYGIMWNAFSKLNLYLTQCHCHCHIHPPPIHTHTHTQKIGDVVIWNSK